MPGPGGTVATDLLAAQGEAVSPEEGARRRLDTSRHQLHELGFMEYVLEMVVDVSRRGRAFM